jgi:riboflavin transporter FmnP
MIYISEYINKEKKEFFDHHRNILNIRVHIISGMIYMSALNILLNTGYYLPLYFVVISSANDLKTTSITISSIYVVSRIIHQYTINSYNLIMLFIIFCFIVPGISHYVTNERQVLNKDTMNLKKLFTNIMYFLPFSVNAYLEIKK